MLTGKCQDCVIKASYMWIRDYFVDELYEWIRQEEALSRNYKPGEKTKFGQEMKLKLT